MTVLIVDIEATCCVDGSIPADEQETIEIGALVASQDHIISRYSSLVRPLVNPGFACKITDAHKRRALPIKAMPK